MAGLQEWSLRLHQKIKGRLEVDTKVPVNNAKDLSLAYSPGLAEPSKEIFKNCEKAYILGSTCFHLTAKKYLAKYYFDFEFQKKNVVESGIGSISKTWHATCHLGISLTNYRN